MGRDQIGSQSRHRACGGSGKQGEEEGKEVDTSCPGGDLGEKFGFYPYRGVSL